jgi:hypothetical protein
MQTNYTLIDTTLIEGIGGYRFPLTVTLTSTDVNRKIEFSADGVNYFQPTYDATEINFITAVVNAKVIKIKLTGAVDDTATFLH